MPVTGPVPVPDPPPPKPAALSERAMDNLRFIRETMEGAALFTAVSGPGAVAVGVVALAAAWLAVRQPSLEGWLTVWLGAAAVAVVSMIAAIWRKAGRSGTSVTARPARRFLLGLTPPLAAGAVLTWTLLEVGRPDLLPGLWLLCYGTAVVTGGAFSVRVVPLTGALFMGLGALALAVAPAGGDLLLACGFGGLHLVSGAVIWRWHGG